MYKRGRNSSRQLNLLQGCTAIVDKKVLSQFEILNPRAAALLAFADVSTVKECTTAKQEQNLADITVSPHQHLHDQQDAMKEAAAWAASSTRADLDLLVVFGIGMGWYWKALDPWLHRKRHRHVIFIEDNLAVISHFLNSPLALPFFEDNQATLVYLDDEERKQIKDLVAWNAYKHPWQCVASPAYSRYRAEEFRKLTRELLVHQIDVASVLEEFFTFGEGALRNFGRNIFLWQKSSNAASLFDKFRNIPAIVVAAGPSLEAALPQLQKLSTSALILSGGSATNALLQGGVVPHFTATVDPNPTQYVRLRQAQTLCLPILYRSRALYDGLTLHNGPFLYLKGGDGYPLVEWFEDELGIEGEVLDGGNSVSNLLIDVAHAFGCSPIILVGYDLAYVQNSRYPASLSESLTHGETTAFTGQTTGELLLGKGKAGRDVVTEAKWVIEANWIERFQQDHETAHLINTSPEGLAITGLQELSLQETIQRFCQNSYDVDALIHIALQEAKKLAITDADIGNAFEKIASSIVRSKELIEKILSLMKEGTSQENVHLVDLQNQVEAELAHKRVLLPFFMLHRKLSFLRRQLSCRQVDSSSQDSWDIKDIEERYRLLFDACNAHQSFLFSEVGWAYLNGHFLPDGLGIVPWPDTLPKSVASLL